MLLIKITKDIILKHQGAPSNSRVYQQQPEARHESLPVPRTPQSIFSYEGTAQDVPGGPTGSAGFEKKYVFA